MNGVQNKKKLSLKPWMSSFKYLHFLLGGKGIKSIFTKIKKSSEHGFYDTYHACGLTTKAEMFSLTASWGSPLEQKITAYFSDLVWESDMQQIFKSFPRDCFDENGYFIKPSTSVEVSENWNKTKHIIIHRQSFK